MANRVTSDGNSTESRTPLESTGLLPQITIAHQPFSRFQRLTAIFRRSDPVENNVQRNQSSRFIFDPDKNFVFHWMGAVAIVTVYNAWMVALRIAFPEVREEPASRYLAVVDHVCDAIYFLDIVVQLRTAYLLDGMPVFDATKIRQHYAKQSYFAQDLIAAIPSEAVLLYLTDILGMPYYLCTVSAARLTKLVKVHVLYRFYDLAESRTGVPHVIRVFRLSLLLAIVIHWIACLYYLVSEYEGLGSNGWVYTDDPGQQRFTRKYIVCMYWSAMILTTIGDTQSPVTDLEYIFTGVIFLSGVFVFATVLGNVGDVISSMNANRQEFQARMDHIKMYLTHKKAPASLQLKIKKWAEYSWSRTKATDESRLLNILPERLRAEVAIHVHLDSLKKVKIFEQCERGFLCELVLKLRSQVFSPGDFVCKAGETGREMFIINHGKVEVLVPNPTTHEQMVVAVLCEGNYFGEISLLRLDGIQNRRTADVRSIGYSELLCLSRKDLMSALVEYPEAKSVLESQAKQRMKTSLQAQRAFSVDSLMRHSHDHGSTEGTIFHRDDTRGRDLMEIKTMIEDLKNSNKIPGRTIWQLIARCELLQSKVREKEIELLESKNRIRDLELLLMSGNTRNSIVNNGRTLFKMTKQFSQDEGRESPLIRRNIRDSDHLHLLNSRQDTNHYSEPPPSSSVTASSSDKARLVRRGHVTEDKEYSYTNGIPNQRGINVTGHKGHNTNGLNCPSSLNVQKSATIDETDRRLYTKYANGSSKKLHPSHTILDDTDLPSLDSYRLVNSIEKSCRITPTIKEEDEDVLAGVEDLGESITEYLKRNVTSLGLEDNEDGMGDSLALSSGFGQNFRSNSIDSGHTLTLPESRLSSRRFSDTTWSGEESRRSSFCSDIGADTD